MSLNPGGEAFALPGYMQLRVDAIFGPDRISPLHVVETETGRCVGRLMLGARSDILDVVTVEQQATDWDILTAEDNDKPVDIRVPKAFGGLLIHYVSLNTRNGGLISTMSQEVAPDGSSGLVFREKSHIVDTKNRGRNDPITEDSEKAFPLARDVGHPVQELVIRNLKLLGDPYIDSKLDLFDLRHAVGPDSNTRLFAREGKNFGPVVNEALIQVDSRLGPFAPPKA